MRLAHLFTLADSRLPTGGHVHSGGMEEAVTSGLVRDIPTMDAFLRRRIRASGLVAGSIAAAVCDGRLSTGQGDLEMDARTPSPAARTSSRAQGRGLLRLSRTTWPEQNWSLLGTRPHLPVVTGVVGRLTGVSAREAALVVVYTTMTGSAIAAQRLLALDPAQVAACTFTLADLCDDVADDCATGLASVSDPLLDVVAQRHVERDRPLFVS
ncbi:urease accessory UreF family protein [Rhodococcus oxybenzonivorans]|uniref:urease accessory protein UreF n=1 Tax=Rhodococcus oxybenzonivorans TaxID=1990687 RepID=UPI002954AEAF|nr:urease accessory UreF family protein [Rhodococcus oxybenzonivorans]MDV7354164.1 urease accessory UreF family protein [Rhodococcus oxybenzonivorans]